MSLAAILSLPISAAAQQAAPVKAAETVTPASAEPVCFGRDEEYVRLSLSPLAWDSPVGDALKQDNVDRWLRGRGIPLSKKVLGEFSTVTPEGIHLPPGLVAKKVDSDRCERVLWKIVRGLFFHEEGERVLPEATEKQINVESSDSLPQQYSAFSELESRGRHPAIFDYRYWSGDLDGFHAHIWGLLLWQKFLAVTTFHDPSCVCENCLKS